MPFRFPPAGDLATEIEWAKNRRLTPDTYLDGLGDHEPPIPRRADAARLPRLRAAQGASAAPSTSRTCSRARSALRARRGRARARSGALSRVHRRRVPGREPAPADAARAAGSASATTSASSATTTSRSTRFTGRDAALPARAARALSRTRRSSGSRTTTARRPQVLALANRLVPQLGGRRRRCGATRADGPEPVARPFASRERRGSTSSSSGSARCTRTASRSRRWPSSTGSNARSADFEEALADGRRSRSRARRFLERDAARVAAAALRGREALRSPRRCGGRARARARLEAPPEELGEREETRQDDLARLVALAREFDGDGDRRVRRRPRARFGERRGARGVHLLTLPPREGARVRRGLPAAARGAGAARRKRAKTDDEIAEERRLLYVGITRAKRHLP